MHNHRFLSVDALATQNTYTEHTEETYNLSIARVLHKTDRQARGSYALRLYAEYECRCLYVE